jgi:hypothetical protein
MDGLVKHLILVIKIKFLLLINIHRYRISKLVYMPNLIIQLFTVLPGIELMTDIHTIKELTDPVCSTTMGIDDRIPQLEPNFLSFIFSFLVRITARIVKIP